MTDEFGKQLISFLPNLRRFAVSLCKSWDIADDLVQLTCEKAWKNRNSFEPGTRMDAWLFRILRNAWIDRIRRVKMEGLTIDIGDVEDLIGCDGAGIVENNLMLSAAATATAKLPDDYREVLVLVCVEELTYKETAAALDVPVGTVMSRLARARNKLAEVLGIKSVPDRSPDKKGD